MTHHISRREAISGVAAGPLGIASVFTPATRTLQAAQRAASPPRHTQAIPALKQIGVADEAIRTMTVEVPRRFFEAALTPG